MPRFDAPGVNVRVRKLQLDERLPQERGFLVAGVIQRDTALRLGDGEWNTRQARAGADVGERAARQVGPHRQRVEQVVADHPHRVANRREVIGLVPLHQQLDIGNQLFLRGVGQRLTERGEPAAQRGGRHHALFFCGVATRFRCTRSSAMAAGVTPDRRAACPTVSGR